MIKNIYIYISNSFDPYKNLALEKYILDNVKEESIVLYLWQNQNTVVIGRNQNPWAECQCELMESEGVNLARRLSGGGAVFHDLGNLNFTFLCSKENYDLNKQMSVIVNACSLAGIDTEISGRNDILADGKKFSGNAFYNSLGKAYHHGTILVRSDKIRMTRYLTPSKAKLEAKGVKSVKSRVVNLSELSCNLTVEDMKRHMVSAFENIYGMKSDILENIDKDYIEKLSDKYRAWEYLYGFNMPFSFSCEKYYDWGNVQICLDIKNGIIQNAKVYTDSMDHTLSQRAESALTKCQFKLDKIKKELYTNLDPDTAGDLTELLRENY